MSPIEPIPDPTEKRPQNYRIETCPHCGTKNKVTQYEILNGFICSGCGKKVDGIASGKPGLDGPYPAIEKIECPLCRSNENLEHLTENAEGKRFRCKACQIEF